jgi:large subunit ribosomal protein L1
MKEDKKVSEQEALEEAEKTLKALDESKAEFEESKDEKKSTKKTKKEGRAKIRSVKYKKSLELVDRTKFYTLDDALDLVKKTAYSKFDGSLEVHVRLQKLKKGESVRGMVQLPYGTGKEIKAAVLDDALIEKIIKDKKTSYDMLFATPDMMPKIARIAKILGPQGKMPNPKSGTVTSDPKKALEEIKNGKTEYKSDKQGIIHQTIGKASWDKKKLEENYTAFVNILSNQKLQSIAICATMGPGIKIAI